LAYLQWKWDVGMTWRRNGNTSKESKEAPGFSANLALKPSWGMFLGEML